MIIDILFAFIAFQGYQIGSKPRIQKNARMVLVAGVSLVITLLILPYFAPIIGKIIGKEFQVIITLILSLIINFLIVKKLIKKATNSKETNEASQIGTSILFALIFVILFSTIIVKIEETGALGKQQKNSITYKLIEKFPKPSKMAAGLSKMGEEGRKQVTRQIKRAN